jgi:hypothetical protein
MNISDRITRTAAFVTAEGMVSIEVSGDAFQLDEIPRFPE